MSKGVIGSTKKKTCDLVLSCFEQEGYSLISKEYISSREKLHSICPNGHDYFVPFTLFYNRKFRCPECSGNKPYTVETARAEFIKYNCIPLFTEYRKNIIPLHTKCPNGHDWFVTLNNLQKKGVHCPKCSDFVTHHTLEHVKDFFEKQGYQLLSNIFENSNTLLDVRCPKGHPWRIRFGDFYNTGYRCPGCSEKGTSLAENELRSVIKEIYPAAGKLTDRKIKIRDKSYIKGFDIDIFISELNKGIEFDGTYHHSFKGLRRGRNLWSDEDINNYHEIKDSWFASKGIQILHIKEEDWTKNKKNCIKLCLDFLGVK